MQFGSSASSSSCAPPRRSITRGACINPGAGIQRPENTWRSARQMSRTIIIKHDEHDERDGERDDRMLPDRDRDGRDERELGDVRDAVRDRLRRRVDRVAQAELRRVRRDRQPAAERARR